MQAHAVKASGLLKGKFVPPGDKSISHRALMFGALADGRSSFSHFLDAADCLSTMDAFRAMGVPIEFNRSEKTVVIDGVGLRGLKEPKGELYLGNSGTSMRLLLGIFHKPDWFYIYPCHNNSPHSFYFCLVSAH